LNREVGNHQGVVLMDGTFSDFSNQALVSVSFTPADEAAKKQVEVIQASKQAMLDQS